MTLPNLTNCRFTPETGLRIIVQVPEPQVQKVIDAIRAVDGSKYGDYDSVAFISTPGRQQFRSLGTGRNTANTAVVEVPCVELSFFVAASDEVVIDLLKAIYGAHPYEEPVVFVEQCLRTLHIRGLDEDNPNRFWNRPTEDWVPKEHR